MTADELIRLFLRIDTFQLTLPHYLNVMVFMALNFSSHTFYISLRNLLYPDLIERDKERQPIRLELPTRCRFILLEIIIFACIITFCSVIIVESFYGPQGNSIDTYILISCEVILFIVEVLFNLGFVVTFIRLRRLRQSRP